MDCVPPSAGARESLAAIPGDSLSPVAPYRLVNIGAGRPEKVTTLVDALEKALGVAAKREFKPRPPGDVVKTFANADLLLALTGHRPSTPLDRGIARFVEWYRAHYN